MEKELFTGKQAFTMKRGVLWKLLETGPESSFCISKNCELQDHSFSLLI